MRCTNDRDWDQIFTIWENFSLIEPINIKTVEVKRQAVEYLGIDNHHKLNKHELRSLLSKAHKMKNSTKKEERARGLELEKQLLSVFNY